MRLLYFVAFLSLILGSCKDAQHRAYLEEIEEMQNELIIMDSLAREHVLDSLGLITGQIRLVVLRIQNNYFPDSINMEEAGMINDYKAIRKKLESNSGNLAKVKAALPELQLSLQNLAHDIDNGVGEREKYGEHLEFEKDKLNQVRELLDFYIKTKDENMAKYREIGPKIEEFSIELVEKRKKEQGIE
jgi:seryl-tRNA synthetase